DPLAGTDARGREERRPAALAKCDGVAAGQNGERAQGLELRRAAAQAIPAALERPAHAFFERGGQAPAAGAPARPLPPPGETGQRLGRGAQPGGEGGRPLLERGNQREAGLPDPLPGFAQLVAESQEALRPGETEQPPARHGQSRPQPANETAAAVRETPR